MADDLEERVRHEAEHYCETYVDGWGEMPSWARTHAVETLVNHTLFQFRDLLEVSDDEIRALIAAPAPAPADEEAHRG